MSDSIEPYRKRAISHPQPLTILESLSNSPLLSLVRPRLDSIISVSNETIEDTPPCLDPHHIDILTLFKSKSISTALFDENFCGFLNFWLNSILPTKESQFKRQNVVNCLNQLLLPIGIINSSFSIYF